MGEGRIVRPDVRNLGEVSEKVGDSALDKSLGKGSERKTVVQPRSYKTTLSSKRIIKGPSGFVANSLGIFIHPSPKFRNSVQSFPTNNQNRRLEGYQKRIEIGWGSINDLDPSFFFFEHPFSKHEAASRQRGVGEE